VSSASPLSKHAARQGIGPVALPLLLTVLRCSAVRADAGEAGPAPSASKSDAVATSAAPSRFDGGEPIRGVVGPAGGSVSRLYFAVVGDTRPVAQDDTAGYPIEVITKIFAGMESLSPRPSFAVSTGDYQYASRSGDEAGKQLDLYVAARSGYRGPLFPVMGNHECTGLTASNCGAGAADGITRSYEAFVSRLLAPIGRTAPFYEIDVVADDGSWTAKFHFVAANAWTDDQARWLDGALLRPTTYTFVLRHEGATATAAPGVVPSEAILASHPYTLTICGHAHTYEHSRPRELIVGNGGAPLSRSGKGYGFATVGQQRGGSIAVDMIDYASGQSDPDFHFALTAQGAPVVP
jgi:hypothetical protein